MTSSLHNTILCVFPKVPKIDGDPVHWGLTCAMHAFVFMLVGGEYIRNQADAWGILGGQSKMA